MRKILTTSFVRRARLAASRPSSNVPCEASVECFASLATKLVILIAFLTLPWSAFADSIIQGPITFSPDFTVNNATVSLKPQLKISPTTSQTAGRTTASYNYLFRDDTTSTPSLFTSTGNFDNFSSIFTATAGTTLVNTTGYSFYYKDNIASTGIGQNVVGYYGIGICVVNNAACWGLNPILNDTPGTTGQLLQNELDLNISSTSTSAFGLLVVGASTAQPASSSGVTVSTLSLQDIGLVKWQRGFWAVEACCSVAMEIGAANNGAPSVNSQAVQFDYYDSGATLHSINLKAIPLIGAGVGALQVTGGGLFVTDGSTAQANLNQALEVTAAGPGSTHFLGTKDYVRVSVGNFPNSSEFGGAGSVIGTTSGIVGAVSVPANADPSDLAGFGVVGYAASAAPSGLSGAAIGVYGLGFAFGPGTPGAGNHVLALGVTAGASNSIYSAPVLIPNSGFNYANVGALEADVNVFKLPGGGTPIADAVGIHIVGASEVAPTGTVFAMLIDPMGIGTPQVPWPNGILINHGAVSGTGVWLGGICATSRCGSSFLRLTAFDASAVQLDGTIQMLPNGELVINTPATVGDVGLRVNNVQILDATATEVLIQNVPLNVTNLVVTGSFNLVPASWADNQTCNFGMISVDSLYIYVCTATNTVKRVALSAF